MSVKTFIEWHTIPTGTYVLGINGHAFTIKERVIHDTTFKFSENCIVKSAYKIG